METDSMEENELRAIGKISEVSRDWTTRLTLALATEAVVNATSSHPNFIVAEKLGNVLGSVQSAVKKQDWRNSSSRQWRGNSSLNVPCSETTGAHPNNLHSSNKKKAKTAEKGIGNTARYAQSYFLLITLHRVLLLITGCHWITLETLDSSLKGGARTIVAGILCTARGNQQIPLCREELNHPATPRTCIEQCSSPWSYNSNVYLASIG